MDGTQGFEGLQRFGDRHASDIAGVPDLIHIAEMLLDQGMQVTVRI